MARYRRLRQYWMEQSRIVTEQVQGNTSGWASLAPFEGAFSLGYKSMQQDDDNGDIQGTFALRQPFSMSMEQDCRFLVLLCSLGRQLLHRLDTEPRPLLDELNRYIEQGLHGDPLPDASFETEAQWLHFLLSNSTNEALSAPLPRGPHLEKDEDVDPENAEDIEEKTLEEGSRTLYHVFAQRLRALLDGQGSGGLGRLLFHTADTRVPVSILLQALDRLSGGGSSTSRTQFSVDDTLHFLSHLSRAVRCRYVHQPFERTQGFVQRPLLAIYPEHRILPSQADRTALDNTDGQDDTDAACAVGRCRSSRSKSGPVGMYEKLLRQHGVLEEAQEAGIPTSLADVVRLANPITCFKRNNGEDEGVTEKVARDIVRHHLLAEAASGQTTPLVRAVAALSAHNGGQDGKNGLWDWALPAVAGEAPRYFHMDRWPLHQQTQATAARVADEAHMALDRELMWDPTSEDPAGARYMWLFSGPGYGYQRTTETHTRYLSGETELQRQVLVQDSTSRVAAEAGIDLDEGEEREKRFLEWLGSKMSSRKRKRDVVEDKGHAENDNAADEDEEDEGGGKKPKVIIFRKTPLPTVSSIQKSVNWMPLVRKHIDEGLNDVEDEDGGEEYEGDRGEDDEDDWMSGNEDV
ncbi:hypothetical protein SEUCBS140593_008003 [Sporothrix eucalyptigena]|uniref:Uncharacterized protein n=1 Tax=Sporothrix eucalyptigena TaxID=1812306 RepID=A0ABP0CHV1_9PEZI